MKRTDITHVTHIINVTHVINDNNDTDATDVGIAIEQLQEKESRKHCCFQDSHLKKKGGLLLSHIALQYHRRKRA